MANVCRENEELRRQVQALLAAADEPSAFGRPPTEAKRLLARIAATDGHGTRTSDRTDRGPTLAAGTRLADRYVIESLVGEGASGRVYRAKDDVLKATVAVKVLDLEGGEELEQLRREAATLRWLRVPGVVNLQDDGVDEGRPYIVTDLVAGTPFPGAGGTRSWASIRETAVALLETLARIHAQGVIHGDLKPSNVLVDERGIPTVLDVGIASGPSIDFGDASDDDLVAGTPSYMAPERIGGAPASVATDLYAVGVMLHQALGGEVPHHATNRSGLFDRRRLEPAAPIRDLAPDVPADAAKMIDALLERDAKHRPASAYDALDLLEHLRYVRPGNPDYPWLGTRELIDKLVQAAKEGRSMDIWGPPGSGKTRTLREAAKEVEALGRRVVWLSASAEPFGSPREILASPILGSLPPSLSEARRVAEAGIVSRLGMGAVLVADTIEEVDQWTAESLDALRAAGTVWRAFASRCESAEPIPALSPNDLRPLFAGKSRLNHVVEDAAQEAHRRSAGRPGPALAEVRNWVDRGVATWSANLVAIDRTQLDRLTLGLASWPSIRPDGASHDDEFASSSHGPGRDSTSSEHRPIDPIQSSGLARALKSRDRSAVLASALALARTAAALGRPSLASCVTEVGLLHATMGSNGDLADELLANALDLALRDGTPGALDGILRLACGQARWAPTAPLVGSIALAALHVLGSRRSEAVREVDSVYARLPDRHRGFAHTVRLLALRSADADQEESAVRLASEWAATSEQGDAPALVCGWIGWIRYRQGRFAEAAELHERAAIGTQETDTRRATHFAHAAQALIECGRHQRAIELAGAAAQLAASYRLPNVEARAEVMKRIASYRALHQSQTDPELLDAVRALRVPHLTGELELTEAAVAWRRGSIDHARTLAEAAVASFRRSIAGAAEALALAFAGYLGVRSHQARPPHWHDATSHPPGVAAQVLALRLESGLVAPDDLVESTRRNLLAISGIDLDARLEILSPSEAIQMMERRTNRGRRPAARPNQAPR